MKPEEAVFEELLAALQSLLSWVDGLPVKHPQQAKDRQRARVAIAKATGSPVFDHQSAAPPDTNGQR